MNDAITEAVRRARAEMHMLRQHVGPTFLERHALTVPWTLAMVAACTTTIDRERPVRSPDLSQSPSAEVETPHYCHFTILRRDVPVGFAMAQNTHAAGESGSLLGGPVPDGTYAYALSVPSEGALLDISRRLTAAGIEHVVVREPDAPYLGQATAIGIVPTRRKKAVDKITSSLPRYK